VVAWGDGKLGHNKEGESPVAVRITCSTTKKVWGKDGERYSEKTVPGALNQGSK